MGSSGVPQVGLLAAVVSAVALAAPAQAASTSFSSSFEAGDPAADVDEHAERASGVTGPAPPGHPGQRHRHGRRRHARAARTRTAARSRRTSSTAPTRQQVARVRAHRLGRARARRAGRGRRATRSPRPTTRAERDPRDWTLQGSHDGTDWTTLDTRSGQDFAERFQTKEYALRQRRRLPALPARHHRQPRRRHRSSSPSCSSPTATPRRRPAGDMRSIVGAGPRGGYNAKSGRRLHRRARAAVRRPPHRRGPRLLLQQGLRRRRARSRAGRELSYLIYPDFERDDLGYPSTYAAVDLAFTDGTYPQRPRRADQHGATLSPQRPGRLEDALHEPVEPQALAHRRASRPARRSTASSSPTTTRDGPGRLRRLDRRHRHRAGGARARAHARPSDWVVTTRGTNSSGGFSRGNNIPATAVPHGFNFWTPVTNAGSRQLALRVPAGQQRGQPADARRRSRSATSRARGWATARPSRSCRRAATGTPDADREARALPFRHANEIAQAALLRRRRFENGITHARSRPPTTRRCCASRSPATRRA